MLIEAIVLFNPLLFGASHCSTFSLLVENFCHPLITFANCLDPDQAPHNFGPDLDPNCLIDSLTV